MNRKVLVKFHNGLWLFALMCYAFAKANATSTYFQQPVSLETADSLLTKADAINLMLENNYDISISRNEVEIAENNQSILNSGYLPSVTGTAGADYSNTDSRTQFGADSLGNTRPDVVIPDAIRRSYNAAINVDYLLFDGLGRYYDYKILQERYDLSQLQVRQVIENTTLQLLSVYYEVARRAENLSVFEQTLENTKTRLKRASYQFEYGQVNRLDVLNARVDVNTDSINLLNARQQWLNAKRDLNLLMNTDIDAVGYRIDTLVNLLPELEVLSYLEDVEDNVRVELSNSSYRISSYNVKTARSLLLPSIGLNGSYGWNRTEEPEGPFFPSTIRTSDALQLGASLTWNIFDGGRSITGLKNAKINEENEMLRKQQIRKEVMRDLANARGDYQNAMAIYRLQRQNLETNRNNYERSLEAYKLGQVNSITLRQAQINFVNAQTTRNLAKYDAKLAEAQLLQLAGELLDIDY